jgi:hypothetical protein
MPAYRVYISSTEKDLQDERSNLRATLEQAGYDPRCMEKYPAFNNRPKDECEKDVRSAHIYVVIIGERYGSLPVKADGTPFDKSFTEYEYEAALAENIPILAFVKKIDRVTADVKLQNFLTRLYNGHGVKEFIDADELSKQVLIGITNLTGKSTRNGIHQNLKYYCNRSEQVGKFDEIYYQLQCDRHIHFFLLTGHELNYHMSFVNRYKCEFKSKNYDEEPIDISFNVKVNPNDTDARLVQTIKEQLNAGVKKQFAIEPLPKVDANNLFELLHRLKKRYLFINMNIQSSYIKPSFADIYKNSLEKFYTEFTGQQDDKNQDKKIIIFLNLKYLDNVLNEEILRTTFTDNPFYADKKLPNLTKVNTDDMKEWLEANDIEVNPKRMFDIVNKYFRPLAEEDPEEAFFMADAEIEMEKIIDAYNNKQP